MGTLAMRSGGGILSRTAWPCALRDSSSSSSCKSRGKQMWEKSKTRGNMSAYFTMSRTVASRVYSAGRVVWWGKATRRNSRVHSAAGKRAVGGNGRGVIVGCLRQYQQRWGFVRLAPSRAAWPHARHDQQQQQQQPEKSWKGAFVGDRHQERDVSGKIAGRGNNVWLGTYPRLIIVFLMVLLCEVYCLRPGWRSREW